MNFDNLIKKDEDRKRIPATIVCKCGESWENGFSKVYEDVGDKTIPGTCKKCLEVERKEEEKKRVEYLKAKRIKDFDEMLPPRYKGKLLKPINNKLVTACNSIICGDFGTGKTWEAYTVAKELFKTGSIKSFKIITEVGLLNDLKDDFDFMSSKIDKYKNLDLLIVDESGKNNDSEFNKAQLFEILNHRYDWEKKTILICNVQDKQELKSLLPTATLDRFRECVIEMTGKSKRYE